MTCDVLRTMYDTAVSICSTTTWTSSKCFQNFVKHSDGSENNCIERLQQVCAEPFQRLTYTEVIEILQQTVKDGHKFEESEIVWGMDLGSEHERYICEQVS